MNKLKTIVFVFMIMVQIKYGFTEFFQECVGVDDETFVASSSSCQSYIYCMGEASELGECDDGEYFDAKESACDDAALVYCALDEAEGVSEEEDPDGEEEEQEEEEEDPEEPGEEPEEITTTTIASTISTTTQTTVESIKTTNSPITVPSVVRESCPNTDTTDEVIFLLNQGSCSDYYLCYHGHAIEMHCTDQLHFNAQTGKCDFPEHAHCALDRPNANKCTPYVNDFFPHPGKCNYFYYCIKGYLTLQQCPFYYGWDIERRACVQMSEAKCHTTARRT